MKRIAAVVLVLCACATTKPASTDSDILRRTADIYWQHELEQNVALQIKFGLPTKHLPDPSYAHAQQEAEFARMLLGRLDSVRRDRLSEDDRISLESLRWQLQLAAESPRSFWLRSPITPYASPIVGVNRVFIAKKMEPAERARLLREYGPFVDGVAQVVSEQRARGYLIPKPEIALVRGMISRFVQPADTSFLRGGDNSADTREAIANVVNPALERLAAVISADYEAHAPSAVGMSQYAGGAEAYRHLIRFHTSLDLKPEEIHELGLRELERISRELDDVRRQAGFTGTLVEFRQFLKTDSRFFAKSAEEVGERLTAYVRRIEPQIPRFFAVTPKAAYDVKRLDPALEGSMTFGYYQEPSATDPVGHYYYNGSKVGERNLLFAPALMLHELIPGHHFQIARQEENESLPAFRRETFDTAFVEGWGEYSASLGREMGIYDDPYDHAGRLMMDSMLSVRLVVDTGMNALGWSRERAMEFMRANTLLSDTEIETETLRYSVDIPAQALAYKIGSLKMLELRDKAQKQLGPAFDIRQFHEWLIAGGSMPLSVLEAHVDDALNTASRAGRGLPK